MKRRPLPGPRAARTRPQPERCCPRAPAPRPLPKAGRDAAVRALRALADPTRLEIFRLIAASAEPVCVCDITPRFDVNQPTISHHLRILREAKLVTVSRRGVWAHYAADPRGAAAARDAVLTAIPEVAERRP